jgi:hypothetical protein
MPWRPSTLITQVRGTGRRLEPHRLQAVAEAFAVAFTGWGVTLYLWSGVLYLLQVRLTVHAARRASPG